MINLWLSMKVSHLHMYTQLLGSSEWQLCFTRRYGSTVVVVVVMVLVAVAVACLFHIKQQFVFA